MMVSAHLDRLIDDGGAISIRYEDETTVVCNSLSIRGRRTKLLMLSPKTAQANSAKGRHRGSH